MTTLASKSPDLVDLLREEVSWGFDTETTGLKWFQGDCLFSMSLHCSQGSFYFDIRHNSIEEMRSVLIAMFEDPGKNIFIHNAKFDLHMISEFCPGLRLNASIYCVQVLARLWKNDKLSYSLDSVSGWFGLSKDDAPKLWIQKHKAYRYVVNSLGEKEKLPNYSEVPIDIMEEYAKKDAELHYILGRQLMVNLEYENLTKLSSYVGKSLCGVAELERKVTLCLLKMEKVGVVLNVPYTKKMFDDGVAKVKEIDAQIFAICGPNFKDSAKFMKDVLANYPDDLAKTPRTPTGLLSLTDNVLETHTNPVSALIRQRRGLYKEVGTYYSSFLDLLGTDGRIHPNFRQTGAKTGRMSCTDPNCQNLPKGDEDKKEGMHIRRCFGVPEDFLWVSFDYKAQEYYMLFDLAGESSVIEDIKKGADPHTATAQLIGSSRKEAKATNFSLLYGSGTAKLCETICKPTIPLEQLQALQFCEFGYTLDDEMREHLAKIKEEDKPWNISELEKAQAIKDKYFANLVHVKIMIKALINKAKNTGWICNWLGRIYNFDKKYAYKAPNAYIQGGAADVVKTAMVDIDKLLDNTKSKMVLQVHDELNFYIHRDELAIIPKIAKLMTDAYPQKSLPLQVSISASRFSWGDLEPYDETRDYFEEHNHETPKEYSGALGCENSASIHTGNP